MWAIPTVIALFILGPITLLGFVVVLVVPTVYIALHSKIREPEGMPGSEGTDMGTGGGS